MGQRPVRVRIRGIGLVLLTAEIPPWDLGYLHCAACFSQFTNGLGRMSRCCFKISNHSFKSLEHSFKLQKLQFVTWWLEIVEKGILRALPSKKEPIAEWSELVNVKEIEHRCVTL